MFGLNTLPPLKEVGKNMVIMTEGEFDAMAVNQATHLPTVSLPNGANSLPPQIIKWFEKYDRIYLWVDNDSAGQ